MGFMWLPAPPRFRRWLGWQADRQAVRSAAGQSSIGSDLTFAAVDGPISGTGMTATPSRPRHRT